MSNDHEERELKEISDVLRQETRDRFGPGFADRVMRRVAEQKQPSFSDALGWMFGRIATAALLVAVLVSATTIWRARTTQPGRKPLDIVLGLPEVSLESAYVLQAP